MEPFLNISALSISESKPTTIFYPIDLAKLNAAVVGSTDRPVRLPSWSKTWFEIPLELRRMVYEHYYWNSSMELHVSPNPDYTFDTGETSHDLLFPECAKSPKRKYSYKNLFLVSKGVKQEAYEFYLKYCTFIIEADTCMTKANFIRCQPIDHIQWHTETPIKTETIEQLVRTSQSFASNHKLETLAVPCHFTYSDDMIASKSTKALRTLIPYLKGINTKWVVIVVGMKISNTQPVTCCIVAMNMAQTKKGFSKNIQIHALAEHHIDQVIFLLTHAMLLEPKCYLSRFLTFWCHIRRVREKDGLKWKPQKYMRDIDVESFRRQ